MSKTFSIVKYEEIKGRIRELEDLLVKERTLKSELENILFANFEVYSIVEAEEKLERDKDRLDKSKRSLTNK